MSVRLRLLGAGFAYGGGDFVLQSVHLDLQRGVHAIVGPNGAGKTTLFKMLAGELSPSVGNREVVPSGARVASVLQRLDAPEEAVMGFADRWDARACFLRSRLRVPEGGLSRWASLSPGERRRLQLAAAFYDGESVLLLDEPTAHLDGEGRQVLREMIADHRGLVALVSHDRALVDDVAHQTLWVEGGRVTVHPGGYTRMREAQRQSRQSAEKERTKRKRKAKALAVAHHERKVRAAQAAAKISARSRIKGPKDSDGREAGRKGRAANAAAALAKGAAALGTRLRKSERALEDANVRKALGGEVRLAEEGGGGAFVLRAEIREVRFGSRYVLRPQMCALARRARVHLMGPNGAGKSTLLRALAEGWRGEAGEMVFLRQDLSERECVRVGQRIRALAPSERGQVLNRVAALGVDPKTLLRSTIPSPGEARKALLALALGQRVRLLLLDEPEGAFDAPSRERLEEALDGFGGAMVLVTHDALMAARLTTQRWVLREGEVVSDWT